MGVPSVRSPVLVTFTPPGADSRTEVTLFTGNGAGVYFVFSTLTFQVPRELSAPNAADTEAIAQTITARFNILRICESSFGLSCPAEMLWVDQGGETRGNGPGASARSGTRRI